MIGSGASRPAAGYCVSGYESSRASIISGGSTGGVGGMKFIIIITRVIK